MKDLVHDIVSRLVTEPDAIRISEVAGEIATILEVRVSKPDLGRVIGKNGRTAEAIRTLVHAVATRAGRRVTLHVMDD